MAPKSHNNRAHSPEVSSHAENVDIDMIEKGIITDTSNPSGEDISAGTQLPEEELTWSKCRLYMSDAFSEFLGTFILLLFGDGVVAQVVLSKGAAGSYQGISWGWG
jgi:hypothetical protein